MTSQTICEANVSFWNGGKPPPCSPAGTWPVDVIVVWFCAMIKLGGAATRPRRLPAPKGLEREQQQQCDQQREDAERFGHGEPEDEVAELALRGRRVAQRSGEVMAEDCADANARATHADAGNARANVLRGDWIHDEDSFSRLNAIGLSGPGESHR